MKTFILIALLAASVFATLPKCHFPTVVEGVLIGLQFHENPLKLLMCLKDERVMDWHDMIPAISFINWHDPMQFLIGFFHLLKVHVDTLYDLKACSGGELEAFVDHIKKTITEEKQFILRLITMSETVENDVRNFLHAWHDEHFEVAGRTTGNLLYEIFKELPKKK